MSKERNSIEGFKVIKELNLFGELAELQVGLKSSRVGSKFELDIRVTFDEYIVTTLDKGSWERRFLRFGSSPSTDKNSQYRVRLRSSRLRVLSSECKLDQDGKYKLFLQDGSVSSETDIKRETATAKGISGSLGLELGASTANSSMSAEAKGKASVDASRSKSASETTSMHEKPTIRLVSHIPYGWKIGVKGIGDPLQKENDYCLSGAYFESNNDAPLGTCKMRFRDPHRSGTINFVLTAYDAFVIDRIGDDGDTVASEREQVVSEMRNRLAGIVAEKQLASEGVATDTRGEIILAFLKAEAGIEDEEDITVVDVRVETLPESVRDIPHGNDNA